MKILFKALIILSVLFLIGCANTGIKQVDNNIYSIVKDDHSGIFGSMTSFRAEVEQEVIEFARKKNKKFVKVYYKEKPAAPGSFARIEYKFRLVDKVEVNVNDSNLSKINFSDIRVLKDSFFSGNDLSIIEGLWSWSGDQYQVAIIKNDFSVFEGYEYLGVVTMSSQSSWSSGDVKLMLNSTASPSFYTGSYITGDKAKEGVTFLLKDINLLNVTLPAKNNQNKLDVFLIRNFPKRSGAIVRDEKQSLSQGSCFFISSDGVVVTNHHVVNDRQSFEIIDNNKKSYSAIIEKLDPSNDLAILKVKTSNHEYLNISKSKIKTGQEVFAVGYPVSNILGTNVKFTDGVISSTTGMKNMANMFQMTVPIQPGNSGGPVLNMKGEVVGISTSTAAVESFFRNTGTLPQNVNWAIKSEYLSLLSGIERKQSNLSNRQEVIDTAIKASCMIKASE